MKYALTAFATALVLAANCVTALATEESTPERPLAHHSSSQIPSIPSVQSPVTTGALPQTPGQGVTEALKVDSDARRVTGSVSRTLERMEQMFRTAVP